MKITDIRLEEIDLMTHGAWCQQCQDECDVVWCLPQIEGKGHYHICADCLPPDIAVLLALRETT